jgi:hypothetical protein
MENSTRIKAVLTAILAAALGGDEALTAAWQSFSAWAFANLQGTDLAEIGGFKIAAVAALGLYLFWRRRDARVSPGPSSGGPLGEPGGGADAAALQQLLRALTARETAATSLAERRGGASAERREGGGYRPTAVIDPAAPPGNPPNMGSAAMTPGKETET